MTVRKFSCMLLFIATIFSGCFQCITGGNLHINRTNVSNVCGLVNGVYVREIKVDSFENNTPAKYTTLRSANLYKPLTPPKYNDPKRLYYKSDCKEVYVWKNEEIIDTIKGSIGFKKDTWYLFSSSDAHTKIFMFIDKSGKRHFDEASGKSGLVNF